MKPPDSNPKQMQYNKITFILIVAQTWRVIGGYFLLGVAQGILAPNFGIPAGIGDVLTGATAIPVALLLRKNHKWSKRIVVVWSLFGIADLIDAIVLGLTTYQDFATSIMKTLPWVLYPTVAVPIALTFHGIILYRRRHWMEN